MSELLTAYIQIIFGGIGLISFVIFMATGRKKQVFMRLGLGCVITMLIAQFV
jgi:hypothetical protein